MIFHKNIYGLIAFTILFFIGCSTQKDALANRWYHKLNTKYNGLFYAKEHLKEGIKKINDSHEDNYQNIISIKMYANLKAATIAQASLDQAIEKSTNAIKQHSMDIDGEEKNKLIPEAYMVIGKAQFYKRDYTQAINTFNYISRKSFEARTQTEALLWVARSQQQLDNNQALQKTLNNIEADYYLNSQQEAEFFQIQAELAISQKDFTGARSLLIKAIKTTKSKNLKTRMYYILGQIALIEGNNVDALKNFDEVIKKNPKYELVFNAKLNKIKSHDPSDTNLDQIKQDLDKMIKDKKNLEYKDQLYFSMGMLELKSLDTTSAIRSIELSAANFIDNTDQKIESHYLLANIFWDQKEYVKSYNHCDSAYSIIESIHPNYYEIKMMLRSSKKIAQLYNIINHNDSIVSLAKLPENERNQIIDDYITELKQKEEALKLTEKDAGQNQRFNSYEYNKQATNSMNITSGGGWYFYNPSAISLGYSEFLSRWGNRKLEDNWRRKNKNNLLNLDDTSINSAGKTPTETEKYNRDYYISQLPIDEEDQLRLLSQIETAYYDLCGIFKEDISDYDQAIILYNELTRRFPSTDYRQLIYFDLHNIFNLKGDTVQAKSFLKKIETEFPNSDYLQILKGGGKDNSQLEKSKKIYNTAHELYLEDTEQSCLELNSLFQENPSNMFIAQIEVLNTFCQARNLTKRQFIESLEALSKKHTNTEISNNLDNMISVLKGETGYKPDNGYTNEFEAPHTFILLLHDISINLPETQKAISGFNQKNYKLDSLEISNMLLNKELQILKVGEIKNKTEALIYYDLITTNTTIQKLLRAQVATPLVISNNNFTTLLKEKTINSYINYFNAIYLLN